jgi:hypothetical protein
MLWYVKCILFLHDMYIAFQNTMYGWYVNAMCALVTAARYYDNIWTSADKPTVKLLYASSCQVGCEQNIPIPASTNILTPTNIPTPIPTPTDLTSIIRAYYRYDTLTSCYSLQKWCTRFGYKVSIIDLLFTRGGITYYARVNLDNDIELNTKKETSDMALGELAGTVVLPAKAHLD